jgi:hypothetical protein
MEANPPDQGASPPSEQDEVLLLLHGQTALLRSINDRFASVIGMLTPGEQEGPSLDELIARLIHLAQTQGATLDRVDAKVTALGTDLPPAIAQAVQRRRDAAP